MSAGKSETAPPLARVADGQSPRLNTVPHFDSRELFGVATEISIQHEHAIYRLKITRQGKLILNK